ncbi:hypothetical protein [Candidatus Viadribacter manganicus]|uniref:Flagellar protein FlaG n=1 Tax=Candidatus Viadribacter manganicus TaxID=1759059 RepID=A0A1B1ALB0_9PROT|nr:hypothetical protein [Candidatus Viadribacter manganicus]ANP47335.1 hypothetical protein ATE48_16130 [Candidatus Viadribacter manganicus]
MASITPSQPVREALARRVTSEPGPATEVAERQRAENAAEQKGELAPDRVAIALDAESQRFVSTLTDTSTAEMLRKYPSESQLAYSRAVMAYLRAQMGK